MKKLSLALATALVLAGVAGSASAQSVSGQFDMTLNVEGSCQIDTGATGRTHTVSGNQTGLSSSTYINVLCNDQMSYVLEVDNDAGGVFTLSNGPLTLAGAMTTDVDNPFGSVANGEGWSRVGTGAWDQALVKYSYAFGNSPPVGVYVSTRTATATF